jgi:uncharacterized protein YdbL (DUF1318 family)
MKKFIAFIFIIMAFSVSALELKDLRNNGTVGELPDGHVAAVKDGASKEVLDFIKDVNDKRDAEYKKISGENKVAPGDVGTLTHKKILDKLEKGNYYKTTDGKWVKKE